MKVFALAAALLATVAYAAPAPLEARNTEVLITITGEAQTPVEGGLAEVRVTFTGAADGSFTQYFSSNGGIEYIHNHLSVSKISVAGHVSCTFYGIDGSVTSVKGGTTSDVGPPQTQVNGQCYAL